MRNDPRFKTVRGLIALLGPPNSISVGTPANQSDMETDLTVVATTVNAAAVTVDTGYKPAAGHAAAIDGKWQLTDRTNHRALSGNVAGTIENYAGATTVPGHVFGGVNGDGALTGSVPSFSVSGTGTLEVTFTPVGGYVGTLEWLFHFSATQN